MTIPKQSLLDCLQKASDSTITILEHKTEYCVHIKTGECHKLPSGAYLRAFSYSHNRYGKIQVVDICYKKCQQHKEFLGWVK